MIGRPVPRIPLRSIRATNLVGNPVTAHANSDYGVDLDLLTAREQEIALHVGGGCNNKSIANRLGITERTVKAHLGSVFGKLGVHERLLRLLNPSVRRSAA